VRFHRAGPGSAILASRLVLSTSMWAWRGVRVGIGEGDPVPVQMDKHRRLASRSTHGGYSSAGPTTTSLRLHFSDLCHALLTYATPGRPASTRHAPTRRAPHRVAFVPRTRRHTRVGQPSSLVGGFTPAWLGAIAAFPAWTSP
jgi:hypothetical protein